MNPFVFTLSTKPREPTVKWSPTPIKPFPKSKAAKGYTLPCGMPVKTLPYKYQQEGIEILARNTYHGLFDIPGCIAGDTLIPFSRAGVGRKRTIRMAYEHFNGMGSKKYHWDKSIPTYARALVSGEIRLHRVLSVNYSGVKSVVLLTLRSGKCLRLTADHEVAMADGTWRAVSNLGVGDAVLTNGRLKCFRCSGTDKVTTYPNGKFRGYCKTCIYRYLRKNRVKTGRFRDKDGYVYVTGQWDHPRILKTTKRSNSAVFEHILVAEKKIGRHLLPCEEVHHVNGIRNDNRPENLQVVTSSEHKRAHKAHIRLTIDRWGNRTFAPVTDYVASVSEDGETDTYDMVMEDPHRNFVANGVVVHNCGKTLQLIYTGMNRMHLNEADCMVVVCRRSHKRVWEGEQLPEHAPHLTTFSILGMPPEERRKPWPPDRNVYVVNYELMSLALGNKQDIGGPDVITLGDTVLKGCDTRNLYNLLRKRRCVMVLDESHVISNPKSFCTKVLHALGPLALYRYISTGTPAAERPDNLWSQIYFLDQGKLLGSDYKRFLGTYAQWQEMPDGKFRIKKFRNLGTLSKILKPIYRRHTDLSELPAKVVKPPVYLTPHIKQAGVLAAARGILVSELLTEQSKGAKTVSFSRGSAFGGAFSKINRAAACPWVVNPAAKESAKMDDLKEFLEEIGDASIIVWCANRNVAEAACEWIARKCKDRSPMFVNGSIPHGERDKRVTLFKNGGFDTLCATVDVLKEAETLTIAHYAYYLQFNFSLLAWVQTQKRIHRIGQKHTVIIRTAFVEGSLDEYVFNKVVKKEGNAGKITGDFRGDTEIPISELLAALGYSVPVNAKKRK